MYIYTRNVEKELFIDVYMYVLLRELSPNKKEKTNKKGREDETCDESRVVTSTDIHRQKSEASDGVEGRRSSSTTQPQVREKKKAGSFSSSFTEPFGFLDQVDDAHS